MPLVCRYTLIRNAFVIAMAAIPAVVLSSTAYAWGAEGNRIVCNIAQNHLSAGAARKVRALLSGENAHDLVDAVAVADATAKTNPEAADWERTLIPLDAESYDEQRDCPRGKCSVARIEQFMAVVADKTATDPDRRAALNWLIRLVADANDPVLVTPAPEGGTVGILVRGYGTNVGIKDLWERILIEKVDPDGNAVARHLDAEITTQDAAAWTAAYPEDWVREAHWLGTQLLYGPKLGPVDRSSGLPYADPTLAYTDLAQRAIEQQLEHAGIRLAGALNAALAD